MYSDEDRIKAVQLYIDCGKRAATVVRTLGYPSKKNLKRWYLLYVESGILTVRRKRKSKYSMAQKHDAVDHYFKNGQCLAHTRRTLGYPCASVLSSWIDELRPDARRSVTSKSKDIQAWTANQKQQAVIELCMRHRAAADIADDMGVSRQSLYKWKEELLDKPVKPFMKNNNPLIADKSSSELEHEVASLQLQIHRLQLERDILTKANELLKKEQGVDFHLLTNREKTLLVDALKSSYSLAELFEQLQLPRSSYFYHKTRMRLPEKYSEIRRSVSNIFELNHRCYGYRRIHVALKRLGKNVSEKVVRRLMAEEQLVARTNKISRYNSYLGEISPAPDNLLNRNFQADLPNQKWLTDITEFQLPAGKVYLSPMIDCFDGLVVSWTISTRPDADLVNTMLDEAIRTLPDTCRPLVHSDRGAHYRWPGWLSRIEGANLRRSISAKGCTPDNAACEGFFGRMKNEFFYSQDWHTVTLNQFIDELDSYLRWYNEKRIKVSLGGLSPLEYRLNLGLVA